MKNKFLKIGLKNWIAMIIVIAMVVFVGIAIKNPDVTKSTPQVKPIVPPKNIPAVENPLNADDMRQIIDNALVWVKGSQEASGHFKYEYNPEADTYSKADNMVRQTGIFYGLGEMIAKDKSGKMEAKFGLKDMMEKSIKYFEENSTNGEYNGVKFKCVLRNSTTCSLGAVGLVLVGTIDLVQKYPDLATKYVPSIEGYKNFILAMRLEDKGFIGDFKITPNAKQSGVESPFSNGEAQLGLVRYYLYKQTPEIKKMIEDVNNHFADIYTKNPNSDYYLWGVAALKDWYKIEPDKDIYNFLKTYTDWRIGKFNSQKTSGRNKAAYVEGLALVYPILAANLDEKELQVYKNELDFWMKRTKDFQITKSNIPNVTNAKDPKVKPHKLEVKDPTKTYGGFLTAFDEPLQRIDFTQHCLNAYLQKLVDVDGGEL